MKPLRLAVVGHTNTGKTSLLRTLLRDSQFGEVQNAAATTRHVEEALIGKGSEVLLKLYDTPGLEDAGGILDWLEQHTDRNRDGIERLHAFLDSPAAHAEFAQEAKVLRQLLNSDCALYLIDAREPVLGKYKDELTVLSWCAKPLMPVFNFTAQQNTAEWTEMLARRNLHVHSSFDTVAFDFDGEIRLWNHLATMLPHADTLPELIALRRHEWQELDRAARLHIAHFLLDAAAYQSSLPHRSDLATHIDTMQQRIRQAEQQSQQALLHLYRFYHSTLSDQQLMLHAFAQNPFDSELLKAYGIRTGTGAATGALIGLGIDTLTLGFSLGLGTALGGLIGGLLPNWQTLADKISGTQTLHTDAATLTLLAARQLGLLHTLQQRGHAAQPNVEPHTHSTPWQADSLPDELHKARAKPHWSALNGTPEHEARQNRSSSAHTLAAKLHAKAA